MRKRMAESAADAAPTAPAAGEWLDIDSLAEVEITSEDPEYPIESALVPDGGSGWRAAGPGEQTIRLIFDEPLDIRRIRLEFTENDVERTQEYAIRASQDGSSFQDVVRQQWNFSPNGATEQREDHQVELSGVRVLELVVRPDYTGSPAVASLTSLRLA
jgi:hypothetical protein